MLQPSTIKFLKDLKKNNNKPWFDEHRKIYEQAKADFHSLVEQLIAAIAVFDEPIGHLAVKDCIFRINRDVRFSKDKKPYKNNLACYFNKAGKKGQGAGYYLHIEPGGSFAAGGIWMPEAPVLASIRQEIDYNYAEWVKLIDNKGFRKFFPDAVTSEEMLVRPPRGYDENNPAMYFLKMKSFIVSRPATDAALTDKNFIKDISQTFKAMKPVIDFLNTALH